MSKEYNGPNVYRVIDVHPAASVELSLAELEVLTTALRMMESYIPHGHAQSQIAQDVQARLFMAMQAIRKAVPPGAAEGERKVWAL